VENIVTFMVRLDVESVYKTLYQQQKNSEFWWLPNVPRLASLVFSPSRHNTGGAENVYPPNTGIQIHKI